MKKKTRMMKRLMMVLKYDDIHGHTQMNIIKSQYKITTVTADITPDPRGIPVWDKVGQLAEVLVSLSGLAASAVQAERIKALWDAMDVFDKRATEVHLTSQQPRLRGRFYSRKRTGHMATADEEVATCNNICTCI